MFTLFTCTLFFKYIFYGVNLPVYLFIWQADAVEIVHMQKIFQLYFECIFYSGVLVVFHFTFILLPFLLQILRATFYIGFYCYIMCHSCFHYFSSLEIFLRKFNCRIVKEVFVADMSAEMTWLESRTDLIWVQNCRCRYVTEENIYSKGFFVFWVRCHALCAYIYIYIYYIYIYICNIYIYIIYI